MNLNISDEIRLSALLVADGDQHLFQGKYLEAVALYDEAIAYNSMSLGAFQGRAFCRMQLLAETPTEEHLPLIQSMAEDLKTAANLADSFQRHLVLNPDDTK